MSKTPTVVIEIEGGLINVVTSDTSIRVIILDSDTECADESDLVTINDDTVYLYDIDSRVDKTYVKKIKQQVDEQE